MQQKHNYDSTLVACFIGYVVQAIVITFTPLLFLQFQREFGMPMSEITVLITMSFSVQLVTDAASAYFVDRIGYRASCIIAHICATVGLVLLTVLPNLMGGSILGLAIPMMIYAVGGGLIEVVISPLVESCPTPNKEKAMSMLHSFFCWGSAAAILLTTVFFRVFGIENWRICALLWSIVPFVNTFLFMKVPMFTLVKEGKEKMSFRDIFTNKAFWFFVLLMLCSGASEIAASQWASAYAEKEAGIDKMLGDLLGPMMFSVLAGVGRTFYGKFGDKINLTNFMLFSSVLCVVSYFILSFSESPVLGLFGCVLCGLSSAIMWPGTYSLASKALAGGGTMMFAFLAIAGDLGGSVGPTIVGAVSASFGENLKIGFASAIVFPVVMVIALVLNVIKRRSNKKEKREIS